MPRFFQNKLVRLRSLERNKIKNKEWIPKIKSKKRICVLKEKKKTKIFIINLN